MSQAPRKLPTDRTIAFAAAIVSSKPSDLTVREYIALLNRHVANGRRENALSAAYRHLDRSAFWRAECERAKDHCRAVEEARLDALREIDSLKAKLEVAKASAGSGGAKRKRGNADVVPYSREVKKGRKDAEEKKEVLLGGLVIEEVELAEDDGGNRRLMLALYQIGMCFKPGVHVKASTLAFHLTSAAADVSKVVVQALEQLESEPSYDKERLSTTMTAAGRVVAGILAGSEKLIRLEANAQTKGQVTHALVEMYQELINSMDAISQSEANTETPGQPISEANSTPHQQRAKAKGSKRVNIKVVPALNAITCLLSGILKHLDAKQDTHKEIFEGFLFCIFSKLGNRVYAAVFSHARATSVEEEIKGSESPVETSEGESTTTVASLAVLQARVEAPYLIHLLKQALALAPAFLSPPDNSSSRTCSKSKTAPKPGSVTKTSLALAAKERLQATLVNAIFGTEGLDEESDLFSNSLRTAAIGANTIPVLRVKEADVGEWFQGEVWRLLGWEVLGREMDASRRA